VSPEEIRAEGIRFLSEIPKANSIDSLYSLTLVKIANSSFEIAAQLAELNANIKGFGAIINVDGLPGAYRCLMVQTLVPNGAPKP
jgi:hypothetical protein